MSVREDIKAYIDGELSPERADEVRRAIESDPELMVEYTSMKQISQSLRALARQPHVKGVEQTRQAIAPKRRVRWLEGFVVAGVLAIFAIVIAPNFMMAKEAAKSDVAIRSGSESGPASEVQVEALNPSFSESGDDRAGNYAGAMKERDAGLEAITSMPALEAEDQARRSASSGGMLDQSERRESAPTKTEVAPGDILNTEADFAARIVIKDASFTVQVGDVREAMDKATAIARTHSGYIEASSIPNTKGKRPTNGVITIRLRQDGFEKAVEEVRALGSVTAEKTSGDDITGQVTDIEARIRTLTAEEESYRVMLRAAKTVGEASDMTRRISQVRQQIESYESQRRMLARLAALSTITVRFTSDDDVKPLQPKDKGDDDAAWFEDTKDAAHAVLTGVGRFVAQVLTFAFILIPVWLPVALFLLWLRRRALVPTAQ